MDYNCLSSRKKVFKDQNTGKVREYFQVYVLDSSGGVGFINSSKEFKPGENVNFDVVAGNDGRLRLVLAD